MVAVLLDSQIARTTGMAEVTVRVLATAGAGSALLGTYLEKGARIAAAAFAIIFLTVIGFGLAARAREAHQLVTSLLLVLAPAAVGALGSLWWIQRRQSTKVYSPVPARAEAHESESVKAIRMAAAIAVALSRTRSRNLAITRHRPPAQAGESDDGEGAYSHFKSAPYQLEHRSLAPLRHIGRQKAPEINPIFERTQCARVVAYLYVCRKSL